jgi:hypothetical protein
MKTKIYPLTLMNWDHIKVYMVVQKQQGIH